LSRTYSAPVFRSYFTHPIVGDYLQGDVASGNGASYTATLNLAIVAQGFYTASTSQSALRVLSLVTLVMALAYWSVGVSRRGERDADDPSLRMLLD